MVLAPTIVAIGRDLDAPVATYLPDFKPTNPFDDRKIIGLDETNDVRPLRFDHLAQRIGVLALGAAAWIGFLAPRAAPGPGRWWPSTRRPAPR